MSSKGLSGSFCDMSNLLSSSSLDSTTEEPKVSEFNSSDGQNFKIRLLDFRN
jgi:hypothetical protein